MRYSKQISTGLMIESQSGDNSENPEHLQNLVANAISSGISESDVEVGYCTDAEHDVMLKAKKPALTYADKRKAEYPPIGDQLDALWKGGDAQVAMKVIIDKVKSDNPKG